MARTFPTQGVSPIDAYSPVCDRPMGYFEFAVPAAATAEDCVYIKVVDASTASATDYSRGLYINYSNTGAKTGSAEVNALGIDMDATANVNHLFGISLYSGSCTGATINHLAGIYAYMEAGPATLTTKHGIWLQMVGSGSTYTNFISVQQMGGTVTSIINSQSAGACATYFFAMPNITWPPPTGTAPPITQGALVDSASAGIACDAYLTLLAGSTPLYIPIFDTTA